MHYRAKSMVDKKRETEPIRRPLNEDEVREDERHQPGWIQKYLDLADLLMRRRREKGDDKAA
jgi:hypothetical protein